jgi:hypothetical protein
MLTFSVSFIVETLVSVKSNLNENLDNGARNLSSKHRQKRTIQLCSFRGTAEIERVLGSIVASRLFREPLPSNDGRGAVVFRPAPILPFVVNRTATLTRLAWRNH